MKYLKYLALAILALAFVLGCQIYNPTATVAADEAPVDARAGEASIDFQNEVIYFLFVDRFSDGNSGNNAGNNSAQYDTSDWKKYWGGDIQGLINKLPYLKDMGITAIWVTPLVDNIDTLDNAADTGYHGYWGKNFFNIDEHLGTWAKFDELVSLMHSPTYNMKLILDYAPNHSSPNDQAEYGALYKSTFSASGPGSTVTSTYKLSDYNLDTAGNWYHRLGGIAALPGDSDDWEWNDPYYCRYKNLFNLADLNQDNSTTFAYLADALEMWIRRGVDAVRLDAVKHMNISFTQSLISTVESRLGKDVFFFGEWMDAGAWASGLNTEGQTYANTTGSSLLDFGYRSTMEGVLKGSTSMRTLASYLSARESYWANPLDQVVFLDNHDMPRISVALRSGASQSQDFAAARVNLGLALTMTVRGVPCVYYGTEHYAANFTTNDFGQVGSDPYNREWQPAWGTTTTAYQWIKKLSDLKKSNTALQSGTYAEKWQADELIAFERKNGTDVVVVVANRGVGTTITVPNLSLVNGSYTNVLGGDTVTVSSGSATFNLSQNEVIVLASGGVVPTPTPTATATPTPTPSSGYLKTYNAMYLRGSMNSWGATAMSLSANYTWTVNASLTAGTSYLFKFEIGGGTTWSTNFGRSTSSTASTSAATLIQSGYNIYFTPSATGTYKFTFNDSTKYFTVVATSTPSPTATPTPTPTPTATPTPTPTATPTPTPTSTPTPTPTPTPTASAVTTTIKIVYDVGYGNNMYIRGSLSPLSWTSGLLMTWTTGNAWTYTTTAIANGAAFEFKGLINNSTWSDGANFVGTGGSTITVYPTFNGNFYDTMDNLNNWTVSGYTGTGKWHIYSARARAYGCYTESLMTYKYSMSKIGSSVTLAYKIQYTGLDSGEYLAVDVSKDGGATWTQVATYTGTLSTATNKSVNVTAYQSTNFKVRFRTKMNSRYEYAYVDNVSVAITL